MTNAPSPEDIARLLMLRRAASQSFLAFVQLVCPKFELAPFQLELIDVLDRLEKRTLGKLNLLITMPPRHGKSWIASELFPAYCAMRDPEQYTLAVSYGSDLAQKFGRRVRDICQDPAAAAAFPNFGMSKTSSAVDDWMTTSSGAYYACGVGGGTTGRPANLLLIDDPIKNRTEADSASNRNKLWGYYNSSLVNRKQPTNDGRPPIEVLIQTRWHPDDLAGRIMTSDDWQDGDWHHIDFPAISASGSPLWPERFDIDYLTKMQRRDPREFAALYQQQPYVAGGDMIKTNWFNTYRPQDLPASFQSTILTVDSAFSTKTSADPSVIMQLGLSHTGDIYILNVIRERIDYPSLKRRLIGENARLRGRGLRGIYIEEFSAGAVLVQELKKTPGLAVIPYRTYGARGKATDKVTRLSSVLPLIEGGRVFIPEDADWLDDFIEEAQGFPNTKHDDQIDALAMGLDILNKIPIDQSSFGTLPDVSRSLNSMATNSSLNDFMYGRELNHPKDYDNRLQPLTRTKPLGEL